MDPAAAVKYEIVSDTTSSVEDEKAKVTDDGVLKATKAGKVYVKVTVTKDGVSAEGYITVRVVDKRTDASTVAFNAPADKLIEIYALAKAVRLIQPLHREQANTLQLILHGKALIRMLFG